MGQPSKTAGETKPLGQTKPMRTYPILAVGLLALTFTLVAQQAPIEPIDFERARGYLRREQTGQPPLTPEERAYLEKAKASRSGNQKGGETPARKAGATSIGAIPLTDLTKDYHGESGGLYGNGANEPPAALAEAAARSAKMIKPLDATGKPSADGKIVLLSIGMSNTTQEFSAFQTLSAEKYQRAKNVILVDGAQGGQSADRITDPEANFWRTIEQRLRQSEVTAAQVQAIWFKQAFPAPRAAFPAEARRLQGYIAKDLEIIRRNYPNLRLIFMSSRIYAGYASSSLNPEPHAYESAFAVRWTILEQLTLAEQLKQGAPTIVWGPYLWADGEKGRRADNLIWKAEDFGPDGTHPSTSGRRKVAEQLERFFVSSPLTKDWYVGK